MTIHKMMMMVMDTALCMIYIGMKGEQKYEKNKKSFRFISASDMA